MIRELGMNPKHLGKIDNHHQGPEDAIACIHWASVFEAVWEEPAGQRSVDRRQSQAGRRTLLSARLNS
jgi:hypothetical protein